MDKLNVTQHDTRDSEGKLRFMPWKLDDLLDDNGNANKGLSLYDYGAVIIDLNNDILKINLISTIKRIEKIFRSKSHRTRKKNLNSFD